MGMGSDNVSYSSSNRFYHHWMSHSKLVHGHQDCSSTLCAWMLWTRLAQRISRFISYHRLGTSGKFHCFNLLIPSFLQNLYLLVKHCHVFSCLRLIFYSICLKNEVRHLFALIKIWRSSAVVITNNVVMLLLAWFLASQTSYIKVSTALNPNLSMTWTWAFLV